MKTKKIIVYSTPTCPYCVYAKNFFKEKYSQGINDYRVLNDRYALLQKKIELYESGATVDQVLQKEIYQLKNKIDTLTNANKMLT